MTRSVHSEEFERLRCGAGLSHDQAAKILGVSVRTIFRYESGASRPSPIAIKWLHEHIEKQKSALTKARAFRFVDLFAGIGGLRLAFESVGGECVFTSEWDKYCRKTYAANFNVPESEIGGDVRAYSKDPSLIPRHDVIVAGFPCQPFSIAGVSKKNALGRPHGFLCDTQGTLFFDLAKIIAYHRPPAFLLENVKNLERHDRGRTFATIRHVLEEELGYQVQYRVINSSPWVPQKRERIFIVGFRERNQFSFDELRTPGKGPTLGSILEANETVDPKYTLTAHLWGYLQAYKKKHTAKGNGFGYSLFDPGDVTRTLSARYFKDGSEILIRQQSKRPRRLTPRECARLMGFDTADREFIIPVSDTQAYKQFGNAVVVPAARAVAELMAPHIVGALKGSKTTPRQRQIPLPLRDSTVPAVANG